MIEQIPEPSFSNKVIDKSQLKQLIVWAFRNYGIARAANMADKLKDLGFYYATKAGISLSLEDLRIPPIKQDLIRTTMSSIIETDNRYKRGEITAVERFQKVIDTWNNSSETLKKEVIQYFKDTDPLNSIYMMAFSGARGNISQVRQLVGMRGLMSDPQGQIIDLPISSNFREGLTITDYFISSYGARKGLVDTALRTADSGYLTRRLVDVAQDVIIREMDCKTSKGILFEDMIDNQRILIELGQALLGRVLAEDIFHPLTNTRLANANQDVGPALAQKIIESGIKKVLVRSPITCDSIRSVCQSCYGWNLAHGRMVDLGEAVGIIAAQSIGEPGTQLTMRTFHTGGVFTGEFAQTICAPQQSRIEYPENPPFIETRTRHGNSALLINEDCKINLCVTDSEKHSLALTKGTLLLVENHALVEKKQIIAEYPLSSRIITERAQKAVVTDFSGNIHFTDLTIEEVQNKQHTLRSAQKGGVVWVLSGRVYNIPDNAKLMVQVNDLVNQGSLLAHTQIVSKYSGRVRLITEKNNNLNQEILIIISSKTFSTIKVYDENHDISPQYILETDKKDKFLLNIKPNQRIVHKQVIGDLISNVYKTKTGGIIKYLDLPVSKKKQGIDKDYYDILGAGYILWISEETHEINKDISLLLVRHGDFVESGTEIIKNIFVKNSGIIEVIQKDGIVREIVIKPGNIYEINNSHIDYPSDKYRGFLRPGERIVDDIKTEKLVYWEYIRSREKQYILIRPVVVYSIPNKYYDFAHTDDSFATEMLNLRIVRRTYFRDGERVKSVNGVDLIKTHLVADIMESVSQLNCTMELRCNLAHSEYLELNFIVADILSIKEVNLTDSRDIFVTTRVLVNDNQQIKSGIVVAQTEIISSVKGEIYSIQDEKSYNRRLLLITNVDKRLFPIDNNQVVKVKVNDWIYSGDELATGVIALDSGKVISVNDNEIIIRIGRPYLISNGSILHVDHDHLVQKGENIATLIFERAKTGDIVQGLPRIEEILEARKKSDNSFNPHTVLELSFRSYINAGLSLYDATRLSLQEIQLALVKEVQLVYQSQGVDIADKHIEVIVRQMTSKVKVENGGSTEYLPGEMVELQKIESVNRSLSVMNKNEASYHPILLGITKASLNTESFISAASFQETTKVLTEAAISGKLDWLRGLKENVIIGRLIPAGTGFNVYNNSITPEDNSALFNKRNLSTRSPKAKEFSVTKADFEDIILDDRSARNYPINLDNGLKN
uniref:DNA-directed RNA polymerase n=1 Tax=Ahnfeltia plicata TaxID=28023 RepID=A0A1C9CAZ1_9FLOR|nr:RNA polymerase beta'' subunit [Ahnfeltia plicata]AOM65524.1 RNA polymerase beta'' subunit [Ahnfeltia plicata]UAT97312.1 RNA polymerase beta'' subunit [Ahnfeltia plicata]